MDYNPIANPTNVLNLQLTEDLGKRHGYSPTSQVQIACLPRCCHVQCYKLGVHKKGLNKRLMHLPYFADWSFPGWQWIVSAM